MRFTGFLEHSVISNEDEREKEYLRDLVWCVGVNPPEIAAGPGSRVKPNRAGFSDLNCSVSNSGTFLPKNWIFS